MNLLKKINLKSKDGKKILDKFNTKYKMNFTGKKFEKISYNNHIIYIIDKKPLVVFLDTQILPTLKNIQTMKKLPRVTIDMGAVPYICKGADIMIPGIKNAELPLKKDTVISVTDIKYNKFIALGITLINLTNLKGKGKAIKNLHYVGDKIWKTLIQIEKD